MKAAEQIDSHPIAEPRPDTAYLGFNQEARALDFPRRG
jgi:hypothetical protein